MFLIFSLFYPRIRCLSVASTDSVYSKSPNNHRHSSNAQRKHVQFPEDFKSTEDEILYCGDSTGNEPDATTIDTPPTVVITY